MGKTEKIEEITPPYNLCGLGGTFDHLHEGHELLLRTALKLGKRVAIAITTDEMLDSKEFRDFIQSYDQRRENVLNYIKSVNPRLIERCDIIPLHDPFGPAITDPRLEIHVSSEESHKMAIKINQIRHEKGLPKMILVVIPAVLNKEGNKISSSDIRARLADSS